MNRTTSLPSIAVLLAMLTLVGVVINMLLVQSNQTLDAEVQRRQQFISQNAQLGQIDTVLTDALTTAANGGDAAIAGLLSELGIKNGSTNSATTPGAAAPPPPTSMTPGNPAQRPQ